MGTRTVKLIDPSRKIVAIAQVADEGTHYRGTIDLDNTPPSLRALFEEFEEIVNGQMFGFLDDIQGKIGALLLKAVFDTGDEVDIQDLQIFPSTGDVSFKLEDIPTSNGIPTGAHDILIGLERFSEGEIVKETCFVVMAIGDQSVNGQTVTAASLKDAYSNVIKEA